MATVDEILVRQAYTLSDGDVWIQDASYPVYRLYSDPVYVMVKDKVIQDFSSQVSVTGERNSQFIGFELPRYQDGIDLVGQRLHVHYQTSMGGSDNIPCNIAYSDAAIRLCWLVPGAVTEAAGIVQMILYATGTNETGAAYTWKTLPVNYPIRDSLDIGGNMPEPDPEWYEQFTWMMDQKVANAKIYSDSAKSSKDAAALSQTNAAKSASDASQILSNATATITQATTAAKADIANKAADTLATIPEDYTQIDGDVKTLKVHDVRYSARFSNALIGKASGVGIVGIADGAEATVVGMDVYGKSEQLTTTGKNLFGGDALVNKLISEASATVDQINKTVTYTASVIMEKVIFADFETGKEYSIILYGRNTSQQYKHCNMEIGYSDGTHVTLGFETIGVNSYCIYHTNPEKSIDSLSGVWSSNGTILYYDKCGIFEGNVDIVFFEPYTGATPSPGPDYPQEIKSVGDSGSLELNVVGSNLYNVVPGMSTSRCTYTIDKNQEITMITSGYDAYFGDVIEKGNIYKVGNGYKINVFGGKKYVLNVSNDALNKNYVTFFYKNNISMGYSKIEKDVAITPPDGCAYATLRIGIQESTSEATYKTKVMLKLSDSNTGYKPYYSQSITIPLTEPLCGIGDHRDRITLKGGIWGVERWIRKVVFDGSADEGWSPLGTDTPVKIRYVCPLPISGELAHILKPSAICSHFPLVVEGGTFKGITGFTINPTLFLYWDSRPLDEFKAWLSANPMSLAYALVASVWEPFPADTQAALNALTTCQGTTNIMAVGEEPHMSVEYVQDINAVIANLKEQIRLLQEK